MIGWKCMIIRYIYVKKYYKLLEKLDVNFGGRYLYKLLGNTLKITKNKEYVNEFFSEFNSIKELTGIIGRNASGKTTLLRVINALFVRAKIDFEFVLVFELGDKLYCVNELKGVEKIDMVNVGSVSLQNEIIRLSRDSYFKLINNCKLIYFSSIFDKSRTLFANDYLIDISTNNVLREYLSNVNNGRKKIIHEEEDIIDAFKKDEILKKINYFIKLNEKEIQKKTEAFKPIFGFPKELSISFSNDCEQIESILGDMKLDNLYTYSLMINMNNAIKSSKYLDLYDDSKAMLAIKLKNEFASFVVFEVFTKFIMEYSRDINDVISRFYKKLISDLETIDILEYSYKILDSLLERAIFKEENNDFQGENLILESNIKYVDFRNIISNLIDEINSDIDDIEEEQIFPKKVFDILDEVIKTEEDMYQELIEIDTQNSVDQNIKQIIEEINIYQKENNDFIYQSKEMDIDELFLTDSYDILNDVRVHLEFVVSVLEKKISVSEVFIKKGEKSYIQDFIEEDEGICEYINEIKEVLSLFNSLLIENELMNLGDEIIDINTSWTSISLEKFLKKYKKMNFTTIFFEFNHEDLSSGHRAHLDMYSRLTSLIGVEIKKNDDIVLLIDEGDIYLHPEAQIKFVNNLIQFLEVFFEDRNVQVIITSNSPFIISDIQNTNIIYLDNTDKISIKEDTGVNNRTFGANIHELLINTFFMKNGIVGEFAKKKIDATIKLLINEERDDSGYIYQMIQIIGEPLLRDKLKSMYKYKFGKNNENLEKEIEYYKSKIKHLESIKK